jgi:hypothetical protein
MNGTIPESLYQVTQLLDLNLQQANFSGTLSEKISNIVGLQYLYLNNNSFYGPVPSGIDALSRLSKSCDLKG